MLRFWRKMVEHLLHALVEILNVFVRLVRKRVARRAAPDQLLGLCVEQIHNEGADFVGIYRCRGVSKSAAPSPAASEAVLEGVEGLLILSHIDRNDRDVASGRYLNPAFRRQIGVD